MYNKPGNVHRKDDFVNRIPVQIKCCNTKSIKRKSIQYSVEMSDLRNFLKDGGAIFFVVCYDCKNDREKIYYKSLLPFDLISIIDENFSQKKCSIKFKPFPNDRSSIMDVLNFFVSHKEKQAGIYKKDQLVSIEYLSQKRTIMEFSIPISSHEPIYNPFLYLLNHEAYIYVITPYGEIPVDYFEKLSIARSTQNTAVSIDGVVYYDNWQMQYEEDCIRCLIGKSISITRFNNAKKMNIDFKFKGTLSERIKDGNFFLKAIERKGFSINDCFLPLNLIDCEQFDRDDFQRKIDALIEVKTVLEYHDVTEDLNMDNLTDTDYRMLSLLIDAYNGNEVSLNNTGNPYGFINIGNLRILVCTKKNDESGLFQILNYHESLFRLVFYDKQENMHIVPLSLGLKKDDLVTCSNFSKEKTIKEFAEAQYDSVTSDYITLWLLELLKAYDISNKTYLLEAAHSILQQIKKNDNFMDKFKVRLNELQIIKRERTLNVAEKSELYKIISDAEDKTDIIIGAYILLGEVEEAKKLLEKLPEEHKKEFMDYPIYSLIYAEK